MGTAATQRELSAAFEATEEARSVIRFDSVCFELDGEMCELGFKTAQKNESQVSVVVVSLLSSAEQ